MHTLLLFVLLLLCTMFINIDLWAQADSNYAFCTARLLPVTFAICSPGLSQLRPLEKTHAYLALGQSTTSSWSPLRWSAP